MRKALPNLLLVLSLLLALCPTAWGVGSTSYVLGDENAAGMMSATQAEKLEKTAKYVSSKYECGVYIAVVEDYSTYWNAIEDCSDWLYQEYFQSHWEDGILLTLNMEDQNYCLRSYGSFSKRTFTAKERESLANTLLDDFEEDDWYAGFRNYLESSAGLLKAARGESSVGKSIRMMLRRYGIPVLIAAVISAAIAFGICEFFKRQQMKSVQKTAAAKNCVPAYSVNMLERVDSHIDTTVSRVKIENKQNWPLKGN